MNINGMGGSLVINTVTAPKPRSPQAENPVAQQMPAMEPPRGARSAVEAKGMLVDTYA